MRFDRASIKRKKKKERKKDLKVGCWSQCTEYSDVWSILSISTPNASPVDLSGSVDGVLDWGSNSC